MEGAAEWRCRRFAEPSRFERLDHQHSVPEQHRAECRQRREQRGVDRHLGSREHRWAVWEEAAGPARGEQRADGAVHASGYRCGWCYQRDYCYCYYHNDVDRVGCDQAGAYWRGSEGGNDNAVQDGHAGSGDNAEAGDPSHATGEAGAACAHAASATGEHDAQTFEPVRITCVASY